MKVNLRSDENKNLLSIQFIYHISFTLFGNYNNNGYVSLYLEVTSKLLKQVLTAYFLFSFNFKPIVSNIDTKILPIKIKNVNITHALK